jgi:hypothetical protein
MLFTQGDDIEDKESSDVMKKSDKKKQENENGKWKTV